MWQVQDSSDLSHPLERVLSSAVTSRCQEHLLGEAELKILRNTFFGLLGFFFFFCLHPRRMEVPGEAGDRTQATAVMTDP